MVCLICSSNQGRYTRRHGVRTARTEALTERIGEQIAAPIFRGVGQESFNGKFRDAWLNVHWFDDLTDARRKLQAWQREYNESRPHRSLKELSPQEFKVLWIQRTSEIH